MAELPKKGLFYLDTEANGAEATDMSQYYTTSEVVAGRTVIPRGPILSTNHRDAIVGSTEVTLNFSLQRLTEALKYSELWVPWNDCTLMEAKFLPLAGTVDSPTAANPQETFQFYLVNAPTSPRVMDELYTYESGAIGCTYYLWDDGTNSISAGIAA